MEVVYSWFANTLGQYISKEAVVFIVSLLPILECRGGLIVAAMLKVDIIKAIPLAVIGNLLPIPFILLFRSLKYVLLQTSSSYISIR